MTNAVSEEYRARSIRPAARFLSRPIGPKRLAFELGFPLEVLERVCEGLDPLYRESSKPKTYDDGTVRVGPDGSPEMRPISQPLGILRRIQDRIKARYLAAHIFPDYVHGGVKRRSNITNARRHLGLKHHFLTDIHAFFPSVGHREVYDFFVGEGFVPDAARLLTRLTTWRGSLPQGTPTSPHLANLIFAPVDDALVALCRPSGIVYTRFVDDLTFSSQEKFKEMVPDLVRAIEGAGYRIKRGEKTYYKIGGVEITGTVVYNDVLHATTSAKEKLGRLTPGTKAHEGLANYISDVERART